MFKQRQDLCGLQVPDDNRAIQSASSQCCSAQDKTLNSRQVLASRVLRCKQGVATRIERIDQLSGLCILEQHLAVLAPCEHHLSIGSEESAFQPACIRKPVINGAF